jgi:nucleoid-associated protein EbfC
MAGQPDLGDIMRQAQKMKKDMARIQEELAERVVTGTSGGGMVTALVNGQQDVVKIELKPEVVDPDDVPMLEDLICAAVNDGMKKAKALAEKEIQKATGGMLPPGLL